MGEGEGERNTPARTNCSFGKPVQILDRGSDWCGDHLLSINPLYVPSPAPRLNSLPAVCFQNGGLLRTLDIELASACQKTPALQAICFNSTKGQRLAQYNLHQIDNIGSGGGGKGPIDLVSACQMMLKLQFPQEFCPRLYNACFHEYSHCFSLICTLFVVNR